MFFLPDGVCHVLEAKLERKKASVCLESHAALPTAASPLGMTSGFALETSWANEMLLAASGGLPPAFFSVRACGLRPAPDPPVMVNEGI